MASRRTVLGGLLAAPFVLRSGSAFAAPLRVASLDFALAEQMIVLGVPPIALADANEWLKWVGAPPLPAGTVDIGTGLAPNIELLAALKPDLIVTTEFTAMTEPQVSRIAPVERFAIYSQGGSPLPKALEAMRRLGTLLGREAEAEAYLADTEAFFAACVERARRFRDKPIVMLSFMDPRHVRVYARPGMQQDVMDRLGLRNAWQGEGIFWGFATIGVERLAEIGEATAVADYMPDDVRRVLENSPLWRSLPLRRDGGPVPILPTVAAFGGVATARRLATLLLDELERQAA
ncbi:MAG: ABC transporter substrate-binding protein [Aurantimonas endophytica]|uniref:ABC transporter substrate-binding protein n=1 Tax=Aurantimonas endophytica TaxID=1522175 RepID=UPI00300170AA